MAITFEQVRSALMPEEPDYPAAAKLGSQALPHLKSLVEGGEPMLASKAAYLASLIDDDAAVDVLRAAAASSEPTVRVAAAAGTANLSAGRVEEVQVALATDEDPGVRAMTAKAQGVEPPTEGSHTPGATDEAVEQTSAGEPSSAGVRMPGETAGSVAAEGRMPGEADVAAARPAAEGLMPGEDPR